MWINILLKALLFILFAPGVHFNIPGTLIEKALIGGLFFSVTNWLVYKQVRPLLESFKNPSTKVDQPCPLGSVKCPSGECRLKGTMYSPCN
jgi:hypothetical protein